jgi:hypothetical protein
VFLLIFFISIALAGCPSGTATTPQIVSARFVGDPQSGDFTVDVMGFGFGPTQVAFDLSQGRGQATASFQVQIFDSADLGRITIPSDEVSVKSPRELTAHVIAHPLLAGSYGLRIYPPDSDQHALTTRRDVLVVAQGSTTAVDAGDPGIDAATGMDANPVFADATGLDAGPPTDGGLPDAAGADAANDGGATSDSGLGPFVSTFKYRRGVNVVNSSGGTTTASTTILVTVPHATMLAANQAKPDGSDIALYMGATLLDSQWDDATKLGTDQLVLIARLALPIATGTTTPMALYFGDPTAAVQRADSIFHFAERFSTPLVLSMNGDQTKWIANSWTNCDRDYPMDNVALGAYCILETFTPLPNHKTIATPVIPTVRMTGLSPNLIYETSFWVEGKMIVDATQQTDTQDLLYFAYYNANGPNYNLTTIVPTADFVSFAPTVPAFTFVDIGTSGTSTRTVSGWTFPAAGIGWTRVRARLVPTYDGTSFHVRFVTNDTTANMGTFVAIDDFTVRLATNPELKATLGAIETHN